MIVKIISGQFLKFFRGLLVQRIDFIHRGFRVRVSLDVNEGQLLNELLLHGITSFLPPQFYHGRGRGTRGAERRKGVRGMDWEYFRKRLVEVWINVWTIVFALGIARLLFG